MPREFDSDGFEVRREFTVRHLLHRPPLQAGKWRWWVHCYRNGRYSGGTPYNAADALACAERLLADGWTITAGALSAAGAADLGLNTKVGK